jgi:hypothetical protein
VYIYKLWVAWPRLSLVRDGRRGAVGWHGQTFGWVEWKGERAVLRALFGPCRTQRTCSAG